MNKALFIGDMQFVGSAMSSSEGESVSLNLMMTARKISAMFTHNPDADEYWILLDAADSGLSIDGVEDLKCGLFNSIFEKYSDKTIYIIVSANEYEMARGEHCFDVVNCKYVNIKSYDRYRSIVMRSRQYKDKRYQIEKTGDEV